MKLFFKQRFFSWFDSYDIYNEDGSVAFVVRGRPAWGHRLRILDESGNTIGQVKQKVFTWLPAFDLYVGKNRIGRIRKKWSWFRPKYAFDCNGWQVQGSFWEWDYTIVDSSGALVARINKELWHWTDHYVLDIVDPSQRLLVLMFVLAIDAEKCSRD